MYEFDILSFPKHDVYSSSEPVSNEFLKLPIKSSGEVAYFIASVPGFGDSGLPVLKKSQEAITKQVNAILNILIVFVILNLLIFWQLLSILEMYQCQNLNSHNFQMFFVIRILYF